MCTIERLHQFSSNMTILMGVICVSSVQKLKYWWNKISRLSLIIFLLVELSQVLNASNFNNNTHGVFFHIPQHSRLHQVGTHIDCDDKLGLCYSCTDDKQERLNILQNILDNTYFVLNLSKVVDRDKIAPPPAQNLETWAHYSLQKSLLFSPS